MTLFLVVSVEEMEILSFAVSRTIREHRQALGRIIAEREEMSSQDRRTVLGWKSEHYDNLLRRIDRLEQMGHRLDMAPDYSLPPDYPLHGSNTSGASWIPCLHSHRLTRQG